MTKVKIKWEFKIYNKSPKRKLRKKDINQVRGNS